MALSIKKMLKLKWLNFFYCGTSLLIVCIAYHANMTGGGFDVAAHYSLIDKIDRDFTINSRYVDNLDEMKHYPPGAHYMASFLDYLTDSPLVSMNLINILALACGWIIITKILLETGIFAVLFVGIVISLAGFRGTVLPLFGLEVVGGNFLFGQFVSTTYFLACIYFLHKSKLSLLSRVFVSVVLFYIGMFFHPSFALFYFSGSVFYFSFYKFISIRENKSSLASVVLILIYGACGIVLFVTHPYTKFATEMKLHNGHLGFSYLTKGATDLSTNGVFFIVLTWLVSGAIVLIAFFNNKLREFFGENGILISSFLFGGALLTILQVLLFEYGVIAPYVVKKNLFGIFTFLLIILAIFFEKIFLRNSSFQSKTRYYSIEIGLKFCFTPVLFIMMAMFYWSSSQSNLALIKEAQFVAHQYHLLSVGDPSYRNTVAQFHKLSMPMNWMITLSQLQVDKQSALSKAVISEDMSKLPPSSYVLSEARGDKVSDNGKLKGPFRVYSSTEYIKPILAESGKAIALNNNNPHTIDYLSKGFSSPEPWGTWSDGESAEIIFSISHKTAKPISVILSTNPWLTKGHESFNVTAFCNNTKLAEYFFKKPEIVNWTFDIPPDVLMGETNVAIKFIFTNNSSPLLVGQSADPRYLGLGMRSLQVIY